MAKEMESKTGMRKLSFIMVAASVADGEKKAKHQSNWWDEVTCAYDCGRKAFYFAA